MQRNRKIISIIALILTAALLLSGCGEKKSELEKSADKTAEYICDTIPEPTSGSVGGEWIIIGLVQSGCDIPKGYLDEYYENLCSRLEQCGGVLDEVKYTEYSRAITALCIMGKDPSDTAGYDLTAPLGDFDMTIAQGINGAIWALIALDMYGADPPVGDAEAQGSRTAYLNEILNNQNENGSWGLTAGESNIDITAMALQALAGHKDEQNVTDSIEKALTWLSEQQLPDGGFYSGDTETSESTSQVIIALYELGLDKDDSRFVKNGNTLEDALMSYSEENGGFRHELDGDVSQMSTEQAFLAITEMLRHEKGQTPLFSSEK
jgi:hypothetical protein